MNRLHRPSLLVPPSAQVTLASSRRNFLRSAAVGGALLGSSSLLAACGGDDGGGGSTKTVKFGVNEAKGSGAAYERMKGFADAYQKKSGVKVSASYTDLSLIHI